MFGDTTITRRNIQAAQAARVKAKLDPLTPEELVRLFVAFPEARHHGRAYLLMVARTRQRQAVSA